MKQRTAYIKYAAIGFMAMALVAPSFSFAQTTNDLQAQIAALLAQIQTLQAQLSQGANQQSSGFCHAFLKDLRVGDRGDEVGALQTALQKEGFTIVGAGGANPVFGNNTLAAVKRFQEKYSAETLMPAGLVRGNGFVGKLTRGKLNALYPCVIVVVPPPPPAPTSTPPVIPPPPASTSTQATASSSAMTTFAFTPNGGTLVAASDTRTYSLQGGNPGDTLSVDSFKNGSFVGHTLLCMLPGLASSTQATSCTATVTSQLADVGTWSESVFINNVQKGIVSFKVVAPPVNLSCSLSLANTTINAGMGGAAAWTVSSTPSGMASYWNGTKDGLVDMTDVFAGTTNFSFSYVYQPGEAGTYTRYLRVADPSGNKSACTTNTVTFTVTAQ